MTDWISEILFWWRNRRLMRASPKLRDALIARRNAQKRHKATRKHEREAVQIMAELLRGGK